MKTKLLLPALLLIAACSQKEESFEVQIDPETIPQYNITTTSADFDYKLLAPNNMSGVNDSILVVTELMVPDSIFKVFNTVTGQLVAAFGKRGEGPEEFSVWPRLQSDNLYGNDNQFVVLDKNRISIFDYDPESPTLFNRTDKETMPKELRLSNELIADNDSVIIVNCSDNGQLTIYNKQQQTFRNTDAFPDFLDGDINPMCKNTQLYPATYLSNGEYIAVAYWMWNMIDILDMQGRPVHRLLFPDHLFNKSGASYDGMNVTFAPEAKTYFGVGEATPECFYVTNYGCTKQERKDGDYHATIYQIDWNGTPVARYTVDRPFSRFALGNDGISYIIGYDDEGELQIMTAAI